MAKKRGAVDKYGNRSARDKRGVVYWTDKAGRRTKRGTPQRPKQPRDRWGRLEPSDEKRRIERRAAKLPPFRDERGKFKRHPLHTLADALHRRQIGAGDIDVFFGGAVQVGRKGQVLNRPVLSDRARKILGEPAGGGRGDDQGDDQGDRFVEDADDWIAILDEYESIDESEFWAIYDSVYG